MTMREYARGETAALLRRLAVQVDRAAGAAEANSIQIGRAHV